MALRSKVVYTQKDALFHCMEMPGQLTFREA